MKLHWSRPGILFVLLAGAALAAVAEHALGRAASLFVVVALFLWLVWRFDNKSGTFLVLAVLFLIVVATLVLLLALLALKG